MWILKSSFGWQSGYRSQWDKTGGRRWRLLWSTRLEELQVLNDGDGSGLEIVETIHLLSHLFHLSHENKYKLIWASLLAQLVKNLPAMRETWVRSLGWEDPLEKGKATYSSIPPWRIPCTVESMGSQRVRHDWATFTFMYVPNNKQIKLFSKLKQQWVSKVDGSLPESDGRSKRLCSAWQWTS